MTESKTAGDLHLGGRPLATLVAERRRSLVDAVLARLVADLDVYGALPAEALGSEIADAVTRGLDLYLTTLADGTVPAGAALDELGASAARRAEERVPLAAVIGASLLGTRVIVDDLTTVATDDDLADVRAAVLRSFEFLELVTRVVVERFQEEHQLLADVRTSAEQALLGELLAGTFAPAAHPDVELPARMVVLRLAVDPHPDEAVGGIGATVAAHRKLRRLRAELDRVAPTGTLATLTATGGSVLLPLAGPPVDLTASGSSGSTGAPGAPGDEFVDDLVARLSLAADVPIHAAAVPAVVPDGVVTAVELAGEVLALARELGRPAGVHRLADVKVEFQLSRPTEARVLLAAAVAPIVDKPDLLDTLRHYLGARLNRRRTALDLGVHPNTVDYRFGRVAERTGLDPTDPGDAFELLAALRAHDAESARG